MAVEDPASPQGRGTATSWSVGRFEEIETAHVLFELLELASAQVGSGRPSGPRSGLWGSATQAARTALDGFFHRVHGDLLECSASDCVYSRFPITEPTFRSFVESHQGTVSEHPIDARLHVNLRCKPEARGGSGVGTIVGGPTTALGVFELLPGFSHVRNGYAHLNPKKTERLPPGAEGILWVRAGESWSQQKPHAFSAIRYAHILQRLFVHTCVGLEAALAARSPLPQLLRDRLPTLVAEQRIADPLTIAQDLVERCRGGDLRPQHVDDLKLALIAERDSIRRSDRLLAELGLAERLYDPVRRTRSEATTVVHPTQGILFDELPAEDKG